MIGINLIPPAILNAHRRARRIRRWMVVSAVVAVLAVLPLLWQVRQHARAAELVRRKQTRATEVASVRAELDQVNRSLAELNERLERANALRTKRSWAGLLTLMATCLPDKVWLTSASTEAAAAAGKKQRVAPAAPAPAGEQESAPAVVGLDGARRLSLAGFALDHAEVYEFMARLDASAVFDGVQLLKADKEPVLWSQAVRFELICTW